MASKIIVALDGLSVTNAFKLVEKVSSEVAGFKGNSLEDELTIWSIMEEMREEAPNCFYFSDPKIKDIPDTARRRVGIRADNGVRFVTVHMDGGEAMVKEAVTAAGGTKITGVSLLTSLSGDDIRRSYPILPAMRDDKVIADTVELMYRNAYRWKVHAFVCSGQELALLARVDEMFAHLPRIIKIVPGVRMPGGDTNDQKRIVTPRQAIDGGADYVVVGREIVKAENPLDAAKRINDHIG